MWRKRKIIKRHSSMKWMNILQPRSRSGSPIFFSTDDYDRYRDLNSYKDRDHNFGDRDRETYSYSDFSTVINRTCNCTATVFLILTFGTIQNSRASLLAAATRIIRELVLFKSSYILRHMIFVFKENSSLNALIRVMYAYHFPILEPF